ncbi:LysM peptidoglycan-binding domain-containing protein [Psychroserpens burtonensis]|uniref:LysM peptidoglycan-binding domain-containing protein n=1 Tax=Psychroserpens burtonensis TaxID=49278 RepID=A0A5C7BB31_9FLAO|nr:LysM peptidoglycan-binding domain-containing protein [Psychroserpens burtonensis]TXE19112.1 LysM peptidoglycan-binding domain-containing protein [Psychroserpens burtonensis]
MNHKLITLTIGCLVCAFISFGQDSIPKKKEIKRLTEADFVAGETYVIDTIIDGKNFFKKGLNIKPELDSIQNRKLLDHPHAAEIDEKWLEELYSNVLFDSIYESVTTLKYDPVDYPELTTDTLKARLKRLNARTPFNVEYNPSLESVIKSYLKHRRNSMSRLMSLSHYYFPLFEESLDNYDIPLEVKYLAIVESALKPKAKSRVGATGLWQFMFGTGKEYGLNVSSYVDERSDPVKSTVAASQYLARLYKIFGDWDLALAAYNSGPGNVSKAIRRSGGYENYWNIRPHLPRETAGYLPAFLATMYIFEFAEEHGFKIEKPNYRYVETDTIHVKQMISLDQVSELVDVPIEELQFLNPSYKLDIIPFIKGEDYTLRLPREAIGRFVTNEIEIYTYVTAELNKREKPLPQLFDAKSKTRYRVRSGDYLGKIARKFGVRVSQIKQWNGLRGNNLKIGQRLTIYPRKPNTSSGKAAASTPKKVINTEGKSTYKVREGDSLWSISQKFPGVSVQNIKEWNDISGNKLKIGTTLVVSK